MSKTDEELLYEYEKSGDTQYLSIIFERYVDVGFRTAFRYMHNTSDAKDALQVGFIQFLKNAHTFRKGATTVKPWLMKMIVNASISKLREEKQRKIRQDKVASQRFASTEVENQQSHHLANQELKEKILLYVESLPERYRTPLSLIYYEGFSFPEAATALSLPEKTVRTQVSRGLNKLKSLLCVSEANLSIALIIQRMSETELMKAPTPIYELIRSPKFYEDAFTTPIPKQKISDRRYAFSKTKAASKFSFLKTTIIILTTLTIATVSGFYLTQENTNKTIAEANLPSKSSTQQASVAPFSLNLDFNDITTTLPYYDRGEYSFIEDGGLEKSRCLKSGQSLLLSIPIKKEQLPLKLSYRSNPETKHLKQANATSFTWGSWEHQGEFRNSKTTFYDRPDSEYIHTKDENWHHIQAEITENWLFVKMNQTRASIIIVQFNEKNSTLYLKLPPYSKIENFSLKTIKPEEVTDQSEFMRLNDFLKDKVPYGKEVRVQETFGKNLLPKEFDNHYTTYRHLPKILKIDFENNMISYSNENFKSTEP